jgi:uncharacterized membrane protein
VIVLVILLAAWLVFRGIGALGVSALATWQHAACYALALMFVFTASAHFNKMKHDLARMVPSIFPRPMPLIYITGVLEFLGAAGLILPGFRSLAGICLIAMLIAMFPANVNAAMKGAALAGKPATRLWLRRSHADIFYWASLVVDSFLIWRAILSWRKSKMNRAYGRMTTSLGPAGSMNFDPRSRLSFNVAGTSRSAIATFRVHDPVVQ